MKIIQADKILIINGSGECKHRLEKWCFHPRRKIKKCEPLITGFPEKCPLENAKEKKV